jgi:hypothetical protein
MAIYNIFDYYEKEASESFLKAKAPRIDAGAFNKSPMDENFIQSPSSKRDRFFSALAARFFFLLLLLADIAWGLYSFVILTLKVTLLLLSFGKIHSLKASTAKTLLSFKRSLVCAIALMIAIFSPALGIMFLCMYFLMYDKTGVDEVVPSSLRDEFKEIFPTE